MVHGLESRAEFMVSILVTRTAQQVGRHRPLTVKNWRDERHCRPRDLVVDRHRSARSGPATRRIAWKAKF